MPNPFPFSLQLLLSELQQNGYVDPKQVAAAIARHRSSPVPPALTCFLADVMAGKIKGKRGRNPVIAERDELALWLFNRVRLKQRKVLAKGSPKTGAKTGERGKLEPRERAATVVAKILNRGTAVNGAVYHYYPPTDYRTVLNIVSKARQAAREHPGQRYWRAMFDDRHPPA